MKKIITLSVGIVFWVSGFGQNTFWKIYGASGKDEAMQAFQTNDGGYIIVGGTTTIAGGKDVYLIKTDSFGDTIWTKSYGGIDFDLGHSVRQTSEGGYIIAGRTKSFGAGLDDMYVIKTNSSGDSLWTKTYGDWGSQIGNCIQQTFDGGYIISGNTSSVWPVLLAYLIKINNMGDTLWTKMFLGISHTNSYNVIQTNDSGYVLTGVTSTVQGDTRIILIKTDGNGNLSWMRMYGTGSNNLGFSVLQSPDGGYVILGTNSISPGGISLIKTDSLGYSIWQKNYEGSIFGYNSLVTLNDGGYLIAGMGSYVNSCVYGYNVYLIRTNSIGDTIWTRTYLTPADRYFAYSIAIASDQGYIIAGGTSECIGGDYDIFLIKTDSIGNVVGISDIEKENNSISLSPNPATNEIRIQSSMLKVQKVEICNVTGQLQPSHFKPQTNSIDISELTPGIYFVTVTDEAGNKAVRKVVKM